MKLTFKNSAFTLIILLMRCCDSYGSCPSLNFSETLTVTCKYNNETLDNCDNPMEGTEAYLNCNMFYEEATLEVNPKRMCREGTWDGPIPQCYPICGKTRTNKSSNTEKDKDILANYPWHVGIYHDDKKFKCGGTLIAMNMVLTAAHCAISDKTSYVVSGKYYIGYDDNRDKSAQYSQVNEVHYPENYTGIQSAYAYNIAIIVLKDSFVPSEVVQPICLNLDSPISNSLLEDSGIVIGWGFTYQGMQLSDELKLLKVFYVSYRQCYSRIGVNYADLFTFDKICSDYLDKRKGNIICNDDDIGGGLALKNKHNNRYYITGIHVWCPNADFVKYSNAEYNVYTAIFQHQSFLKNYTANIETKNCLLPNYPSHGKYVFLNTSGTFNYAFNYAVPPHSKLNLTCNIGYTSNFTSSGAAQYYCSKYGQWNPALITGCTRNASDEATSPLDTFTTFNYNYVIVIVSSIVIFVILVAIVLYKLKYKQEWELRREIKLAGLYRFRSGNLKRLNPELDIGDQAEILPYNNNFEFPRDKLKLGKQLGSGTFGIVIQADAFGIFPNEEKTTVAVKMVKDVVDHIHLKALISELKIMVHLGQHLNIVNLLGACTQNITKRELLVIVEYCQFGNLYNYLLRNRKNYVNQIDDSTGYLDYTLGTDNSSVTNPEHNAVERIKPIYTKDLISWSFQVARGMEYLASRKILHGDLAARNILLAENNIVKICDFGLSRKMYQNVNYKKQQNSPLPIKWMAIECIRDRVFSTQSDVWSFGIVLWEFFSLAQTPYPGMEADERLYYKLLDGYKMDSPSYAPKEIYNIMCDCWSYNPESRPSFNELAGKVGLMLEENVRQHYIDLNDPYLLINTQKLRDNHEDYIAMLSPSGFQQVSIPHSYIGVISNDQPQRASANIYTTRTIDPTININANNPNNEKVPSLPNDLVVTEN